MMARLMLKATKSIKRAKVITARKASKMIDDALYSITRRLKNVQNEALKDYADKEMTK